MGKFCQFLTVICPRHFHIFISDVYLSNCEWIFTKLGMCIDILESWSRIADGQISSIFDRVICP